MVVIKQSVAANQLSKRKKRTDSDRAIFETSGEEKRSEVVMVIKLSQEYERKIEKATIEITGEAKCLEEGALRNAREVAGDWRKQFKGHLRHELSCAGEIKWLEAGDRKALRVTHGSQRLLIQGETSMWAKPLRRAGWHNLTSLQWRTCMVPTSKQAKLVSKLMSERRVILLVGVVDCNNGVDTRIRLFLRRANGRNLFACVLLRSGESANVFVC